jgi:hypothetical protein
MVLLALAWYVSVLFVFLVTIVPFGNFERDLCKWIDEAREFCAIVESYDLCLMIVLLGLCFSWHEQSALGSHHLSIILMVA